MFSTEMEFAKICASTQNWKISHVNSSYEVGYLIYHVMYNYMHNFLLLID